MTNNYEEKYKQALKVASQWHKDGIGDVKTIVECIFPELRESEDERIRKELLEHCLNRRDGKQICVDASDYRRWAVWLEKQGEQKPVEQDTEIHDLWVYIREWNEKFGRLPKDEDELASCIDYVMKRQKTAWSEEDEKMRSAILQDLINIKTNYPKINLQEEIDWLKSLKPNHWKPSEEQIKALETTIHISNFGLDIDRLRMLESLYNDLLKL